MGEEEGCQKEFEREGETGIDVSCIQNLGAYIGA
jgi:hypothetical protein